MTVKFTNNASTTVATGINTTATSLVVTSATGFPTLSGSGDYCYLTIQQASGNFLEVVKATALSSNTFTIVRAQDGTSAGSWSTGDVVELRITAALLTDIAEQADETVSLTGAGATSISGSYPSFTITSTDTNTVYSVGDGGLTQNNFTNTLKSKLDGIEASANVTDTANVVGALTAGTNVTIASDGTISSTDTTYGAGSGITLSGTTFSNAAPDQTVALTGSGGTTVSGTYPNFTISSAASIDGTTINPSNIKISGTQGTDGQVLTSTGSGVAWEDSTSAFTVQAFTANGSTTAFTLSTAPGSENSLMVFIEGVYQNQSDFTLSGTTLTLDAAPPNGRKIVVYQTATAAMGVISSNAVGISQLNVSDGTNGQVLKTNGSGTLSFGDVAGGGSWNFISATSIGANTSSVEVTLSGYSEYVVRFSGINAGTSEFFPRLELRDSGQSGYSLLRYKLLSQTTTEGTFNFGASDMSVPLLAERLSSADGNYSGEIRIANVAGQPAVFGNAFSVDQGASGDCGYIHFVAGLNSATGTEVFNKVKIRNNSGNMQAGTVYLYGITTS